MLYFTCEKCKYFVDPYCILLDEDTVDRIQNHDVPCGYFVFDFENNVLGDESYE